MSKRLKSFDVAKAMAIIAVIVGHTAIRYAAMSKGALFAVSFTFTFHLPIFFFISGYFLHAYRPFSFGKEARSLILPYIITALLILTFICLENLITHAFESTRAVFNAWLSAALYGAGDIPPVENSIWPQAARIGGIWFLLALFWARLVTSLSFKTSHPFIWGALSFLIGLTTSRFLVLPFDIQSGLCAVPFVMFGTYARNYRLFERKLPKISWILMLVIWLWAIFRYNGFSMAMCGYGTTPVSFLRNILGAASSTICIVGGLYFLESKRACKSSVVWAILGKIGTLTLYILCIHIFEDSLIRWDLIVKTTQQVSPDFMWVFIAVLRTIIDILLAIAARKTFKTIGQRISPYIVA